MQPCRRLRGCCLLSGSIVLLGVWASSAQHTQLCSCKRLTAAKLGMPQLQGQCPAYMFHVNNDPCIVRVSALTGTYDVLCYLYSPLGTVLA